MAPVSQSRLPVLLPMCILGPSIRGRLGGLRHWQRQARLPWDSPAVVASTLLTSPGVGCLSGDTGPGPPEMRCRRPWGLGCPLLLAMPSLGSAPSQHRVQRAAAHLGSHGELRPPSSVGALRGQQPHVTEQGGGAGGWA